jgi:hypothetical protein
MTEKAKWNKATIRAKLETSDAWLTRGLVAIYNKQTDSEQNDGQTHEDNGIGFNGADAELLSSYASQFIARGFLTPKQIEFTRKKMLKYSGQLAKIANGTV